MLSEVDLLGGRKWTYCVVVGGPVIWSPTASQRPTAVAIQNGKTSHHPHGNIHRNVLTRSTGVIRYGPDKTNDHQRIPRRAQKAAPADQQATASDAKDPRHVSALFAGAGVLALRREAGLPPPT